MLLFISGVH